MYSFTKPFFFNSLIILFERFTSTFPAIPVYASKIKLTEFDLIEQHMPGVNIKTNIHSHNTITFYNES